MFASTEFRQDLVKADYVQFLNRPADPTGLNAFTAALQQGQTDQQLGAAIAGSAEFFARL